jgi:hypothetical protein
MSLGLGLVLPFSLFSVMRQLGVGRWASLVAACASMMAPQVIAYEFLLGNILALAFVAFAFDP